MEGASGPPPPPTSTTSTTTTSRAQPPPPMAFDTLWELYTSTSTLLPRVLFALLFLFLYLTSFIAYRVLRPHILTIPTSLEDSLHLLRTASAYRTERKQNVVFAGSFNPVHLGHITMLKFLAAKHCEGTVTAVVGFNPAKRYDVTPEQRVELIERACRDDPDVVWRLIKMADGAPPEGGSRSLLQWAKSPEAHAARPTRHAPSRRSCRTPAQGSRRRSKESRSWRRSRRDRAQRC